MQKFVTALICYVSENGLSDAMTFVFMFLSFVPVVIFGRKISQRTNVSAKRIALFMAITYVANFVAMLVLAWIEAGFQYFGAQNGIRSFSYTPLLCGIFCKIFKIEWKQGNAIWAICLPFSHGIAHIGCIFSGCCYGYPCSRGIYNILVEQYLFPVQLLESTVAVLIGVYILQRAVRMGFSFDGREYPIMLVLFGSTRFICEYFRDNEKLWLGCSSLAFHALFMCVVGIIWLLCMHKNKSKCEVAVE